MELNKIINSEVLIAYFQCPRKAFLLLCTQEKGINQEYLQIIQQNKNLNQKKYIKSFKEKNNDVQLATVDHLKQGFKYITNATLCFDNLETYCGVLRKVEISSSLGEFSYEPMIFTGTFSVEREHRLELLFIGYILEKIQNRKPKTGKIITIDQTTHTLKLQDCSKIIVPLLEQLQECLESLPSESPPIILNKHCSYCQFQKLCITQAEQEDNISLIDHISNRKIIDKYEKKGIFTLKQLSYLFKPKKRRRNDKKLPKTVHEVELQALAIRTNKIYLQEIPAIPRQLVELFLDIEGICDRQEYYLIGLLVCEAETSTYHYFWSDNSKNEAQIWQFFLEKVNQYPNAPIYHYGSYELRAVEKLGKRYAIDNEGLKKRLVNINTFIFGKVYFPVRSNGLKDIGKFIEASWTTANASGLQSLIWRHYWEETHQIEYKQMLLTYNEEDCRALKLLTDELSKIKDRPDSVSCFAFARHTQRHVPKTGLSENDNQLHHHLNTILKFSYSDYDKKKICFRPTEIVEKKDEKDKKYEGHRKVKPKATKIVQVSQDMYCPEHDNELLRPTKHLSKRLIVDLVLTKKGINKTIIEYVGSQGYCSKCRKRYAPIDIRKFGVNLLYGDGFKAWFVYLRVALRLPYKSIATVINEQFNEQVPAGSTNFIKDVALKYKDTELIILNRLLKSPFVHADETTINIYGVTQYVWVFTNGKYTVFKLRESREATIAHELLENYDGVLISDFYSGYDSLKCKQQKCWVHLIRDLNNDLWQTPFDTELENFVLEVKNLLFPIMNIIHTYGLKQIKLEKFMSAVDTFYQSFIIDKRYKSELVIKYRKRFIRYKESLFTFLQKDEIPWHNNTAERAIRNLAKQREISGTFGQATTHHYLLLLGIMQTCRFQNKSFFKFLLSGEKDIDNFH